MRQNILSNFIAEFESLTLNQRSGPNREYALVLAGVELIILHLGASGALAFEIHGPSLIDRAAIKNMFGARRTPQPENLGALPPF